MIQRQPDFSYVASVDKPIVQMEMVTRGDKSIIRCHHEDDTITDIDPETGLHVVKGDA